MISRQLRITGDVESTTCNGSTADQKTPRVYIVFSMTIRWFNHVRVHGVAKQKASSQSLQKIVSGLRDNTIKMWDRASLACLRTLNGHTGSVLCLQYDDKVIISGSSDSTVRSRCY